MRSKKTIINLGTSVIILCATVLLQGCSTVSNCPEKKACTLNTNDFYTDGAMDAAAVKQAYFDMMERFNYPIPDILKTDNFWVCDFDQADVLALGMGGIFWINEKGEYKTAGAGQYKGPFKEDAYGYLLHEIYLLPGQTLPEHRHLGGNEGYGPKMESWQVRYGEVNFHSEVQHGDAVLISEWPEADRPWGYGADWFKSKYIAKRDAKTNQMMVMSDPESWHGQCAGPEGAIVTEVATYHNHVTFSKPGMEFKSTGNK
jgi:D-lyxose ketol-isomerase